MFLLFLFLLLFLKNRWSSGLTGHHTPPRTCCCFSFSVPAALSCSPVLALRPFCSGVSSGCHSGPRAFFGFSRDSSEAFFGREAVEAFALFFLWPVFFPVLQAPRVSSGPCAWLQDGRPAPAPPARVRVGGRLPFSGGGTKTPLLFGFFSLLVSNLATGAQEPFCLRGHVLSASSALTRTVFSPGLSLSLLSLLAQDAVLQGHPGTQLCY